MRPNDMVSLMQTSFLGTAGFLEAFLSAVSVSPVLPFVWAQTADKVQVSIHVMAQFS